MAMAPELQPDELAVLQAEDVGPDPLIRVDLARADVPVRVQPLPRKSAATFQKTVTTTPQRILKPDHRRAAVQLMSVGQNMLVAFSQAAAGDSTLMALWPANMPLPVGHDGEVWVASATSTTVVSVIVENWAAGE